MSSERAIDRALGALWGGALGDALGMPTQTLSREEIVQAYGLIDDFVAPFAEHPVSHGLDAGAITDDTEQSLLLARQLVTDNGSFDEHRWVDALLEWERDVAARGLRDLLGPSTKRALEDIQRGVSTAIAGRGGDTNGAAMRVAPIGIATPLDPLERFVDRVEETCRVTHNTGAAIASAAAVAAAISAGISGANWRDAIGVAIDAARAAQMRGHETGAPNIAERIELACRIAGNSEPATAPERIVGEIGTDVASWQSVPAAFGLLHIAGGDTWQAGLIGARIGGDTDTVAAIACGMAGACAGLDALPRDRVGFVARVNGLDLMSLATSLLALRDRAETVAEAV